MQIVLKISNRKNSQLRLSQMMEYLLYWAVVGLLDVPHSFNRPWVQGCLEEPTPQPQPLWDKCVQCWILDKKTKILIVMSQGLKGIQPIERVDIRIIYTSYPQIIKHCSTLIATWHYAYSLLKDPKKKNTRISWANYIIRVEINPEWSNIIFSFSPCNKAWCSLDSP